MGLLDGFWGVRTLGDLGFSRVTGLVAAFLGQWLSRDKAERAAVLFVFATLGIIGLWIGSQLARLVNDPALSLDVAACGLYMVTGAVFWRLIRARG